MRQQKIKKQSTMASIRQSRSLFANFQTFVRGNKAMDFVPLDHTICHDKNEAIESELK